MQLNFVSHISELSQHFKELLLRIKTKICWPDLVGVLSLLIYLFVCINAILTVKTGITTYDSTQMLGMARDEITMSTSANPFYILYLRVVMGLFGEAGIIYVHYLAGAITGLMLVWVFGRKNILSWSGFWVLSMPSYALFNLMVWKDVLFLYLVCISVALIIKSDRDTLKNKVSIRNLYVIITFLLALVCLIRMNGNAVALILIVSFLINKKNIKNKLSSLVLALVLAAGVNSFIKNHYEVIETKGRTTKDLAVRMIGNDYLYYKFCLVNEDVAGLLDKRNKIYRGLPSYCENSYTLDVARSSLSKQEQKVIFNDGLELFLQKPYIWFKVKYEELYQYLSMMGAYVFPANVPKLSFKKYFWLLVVVTFSPAWIFILFLYVIGRTALIKYNVIVNDVEHRDILIPVSIFSLLFCFSLTIPFMTNDSRYFLPAVFISLFVFIIMLGKDLSLKLPVIKSAFKRI